MSIFNKRAAGTPPFADSAPPSASHSSKPANDLQVELIRVAFKDTVRSSGLPPSWLGCEVHTVARHGRGEHIQVHLVIERWNEQLLRYSMPFQNRLIACLDRYEPHVDHTRYEWVWRYAGGCDCPHPALPAPQEWLTESTPHAAAALPSVAVPRRSPSAVGAAQATPPAAKAFDLRDVFADLK